MSEREADGDDGDRIVGLRLEGETSIRVYRRTADALITEDAVLFPFFFLSDATLLLGFQPRHWLKECTGKNHFRYIAAFQRWRDMWDAVQHVSRQLTSRTGRSAGSYTELDAIALRPDPLHQFLLQSGKTLFGNMPAAEIRIASLALGWTSSTSKRSTLPVVRTIAWSSEGSKTVVLDRRKTDDRSLIESLNSLILEHDPDIITGEHLLSSVIPWLTETARSCATDLAFGREGRSLRFVQDRDGLVPDAPGRWFVDPVALAAFVGHGSEGIEELSFDQLAASRPSIPAQGAATNAPSKREPGPAVLAARQAEIGLRVVREFLPHAAACAALFPIPAYRMLRETDASIGESLLLRSYVEAKHSVPMGLSPAKQSIPVSPYWVGIFESVIEAGIPKLLSHVLDQVHPQFRYDEPGIFQRWYGLTNVGATSGLPSTEAVTDHVRRTLLAAVERHGSLFFDDAWMKRVDAERDRIFGDIVRQIELHNGLVLQRRRSRLFVALPDNIAGETNERKLFDRISDSLPPDLHLTVYRHYERAISYHHHTLVMLLPDSTISIRGNGFLPRGLERFASHFKRRCIEALLTGQVSQLHHTYASYHTLIRTRQLPVADLARTEILHEEPDEYQKAVKDRRRIRSAAYEAVFRSGRRPPEGTSVSFYVAGNDPEPRPADHSKLVEEWDSGLPDENITYYLQRLDEISLRFKDFFAPGAFRRIFSLDDLFGFSPDQVTPVRTRIDPATPVSDGVPPGQQPYGIWLDSDLTTEPPQI